MDSTSNDQPGSTHITLELFPKKKRYSKYTALPVSKKKKAEQTLEPKPHIEEAAVSDLDSSDDADDDSASDHESDLNLTKKPQICPNVLHSLRNGFDIFAVAIEEIALEGLDGITIEALWTRLRFATDAHINETLKISIWNKLIHNCMFRFYELPEKRPKLEVFKCFDKQQEESKYLVDLGSCGERDIYSVDSVKIEGVFGACDFINTRLDVSDKVTLLTLNETEVCYGNKLVIVADDKLRTLCLFTEFHDPNILVNYSELQYRILERVGRSRKNGEISGEMSALRTMCRDPKSLSYYRKSLKNTNVIMSQPIIYDNVNQNQSGTLLQLQRFYSEKKLRKHRFIEYLVRMLKAQPQYIISYAELFKRIGLEQWTKLKGRYLMKSPDVGAVVNRIYIPYRMVYPNAKPEHWKKKNKNEERHLWVLQLKDPNINLQQFLSKEDPASDDSSEDEDTQPMAINSCLSNVAYKVVYDAGADGISIKNFIKISGIDYYTSRKLLTSLSQRKMIIYSKHDVGKQRLKNYVAVHFCNDSSYKVVEESVQEVDVCDDNTIDFIANVLHIDSDNKHHLKQCSVVESDNLNENTETTMGEYEAIKLMRPINTMSALCKVIYENKHDFEKLRNSPENVVIQLEKPSVTIDNNIRQLFRKTCQTESQCFDETYINKFVMKTKFEAPSVDIPKRIMSSEISFYNVREIKQFYPILERQKLLQSNLNPSRFKIILNKASKAVKKMHLLKSDPEDYVSNISVDEDDLENIENASVLVNFEDNSCSQSEYSNTENTEGVHDIKDIMLNCFEIDGVILSNYIPNIENEDDVDKIESIITKRQLESVLDNNLPISKHLKVDQHFDETLVSETSPKKFDSKKKPLSSYLDFGTKPEILKVCSFAESEVKTILSSEPERYAEPDDVFLDADLTPRVMGRSIIVIDFIRINKIVTDCKLIHHVQMIEKMRGYTTLLDKKTLFRIISRLITVGFIRVVKLLFKVKRFCRSRLMFFLPGFILFPYLNNTIDHAMFSLRMYARRKMNFLLHMPNVNVNTPLPTKYIPTNPSYKLSQTSSYQYGYLQKFSRIQLMHQFMFYLIYDYSGVYSSRPPNLASFFDDDDELAHLPEIYKNEITWKMFIPPLPKYNEYADGWAYIDDLVLRLPLSVYVRVCSVVYIIPELPQYLNHPVKRHYLVKDLPLSIVDAMHSNRRYLDIIYPLFCYLCYMGLLQCGPKYLRSKFDMYVYLNRRAIIYDTVTSDPGYHEVTDKEYEQLTFYFDAEKEILRFWTVAWSTSIRSKLGFRYSILGTMITLENIHNKETMIESMSPITAEAVYERDVGYIPGDRRGACGYDSALWIHVRRNWSKRIFRSKESQGIDVLALHTLSDNGNIKSTNSKQYRRKAKTQVKVKHQTKKLKRKVVMEPKCAHRKLPTVIKRVVKERILAPVKDRNIKDDLDKQLQETYSGARAKFNSTEMLALSVCLEVLKYMKTVRHSVSTICIRDFMHRVCKNTNYKKTSSAYRRRMLHIEGSSKDLCSSDALFVKNLNSSNFVQKYYTLFLKRIETKKVTDAEIRIAFLYLAYFTMQRCEAEKPTYSFKNHLTDKTVKSIELWEHQTYTNTNYVKPCTKEDIKYDTVQSLIHSCLTCVINDENWRAVLFKSFQFYSEETIRRSVKNMQVLQILSSKKGFSRRPINEGVLLVTGNSYQLSFAYCFNQITNYPNSIFQNAVQTIALITEQGKSGVTKLLIESYENEKLIPLFELSCISTLSYEIELHSDLLTINPLISDHTVLINELVRRCGIILKNMIQNVPSKDENDMSIENVESIISKMINSDSSEPIEGAQLIETIIENSQYLDKDDENTDSVDDSKSTPPIQQSSDVEYKDFRNKSIYGLKSLLTKGLFPDLDDDDKLEELENHFVPKYPNIWLDINCWADLSALTLASVKFRNIIDDLERDAVYMNTTEDSLQLHFEEEDFIIVQSLVDFIRSKEIFGASLSECYDLYKQFSTVFSFQDLMEKLTNLNYIMIHGITSLTVIHNSFIDTWTNPIDSLTSESKYIDKTGNKYRVKLMPWLKVDGTIYVHALKNWMCIILSHCLSYPQTTVQNIVDRFPFMKPIDIYTILKVIHKLGCISLNIYQTTTITTLFSESSYIDLVPAPYHSDISSLTVSVENCAVLIMGYALQDCKTA